MMGDQYVVQAMLWNMFQVWTRSDSVLRKLCEPSIISKDVG